METHYHDKLLHPTVDKVSDAFRHRLPHPILHLQLHVHVSVVEQIEEAEPLSIEFLDRRRVPPVLVEFPVCIHCQLGEGVREGLEQKEDKKHNLKDHRHLKLQVELKEGSIHIGSDNRDDVLSHYEILHEHIHCETDSVAQEVERAEGCTFREINFVD